MVASWNKTFEKRHEEFSKIGVVLQEADLSQGVSFTGMKPVAFCIKSNVFELNEQTWKSLYIITLATLYAQDSYRVRHAIYNALSGRTSEFDHYAKISDHMFANVGLSATAMIGYIKRALSACNIPLDRFKIAYYSAKDSTTRFKVANHLGVDSFQQGLKKEVSKILDMRLAPKTSAAFGEKHEQSSQLAKPVEKLLDFDKKYESIIPLYFVYFDEKKDVLNWDDLHKKVLREICGDYPALTKANLLGRVIFDNPFAGESLERLNEKFYVEGNLSQQDSLGQIRTALYLCGIPFDKVKVFYSELEYTSKPAKTIQTSLDESLPQQGPLESEVEQELPVQVEIFNSFELQDENPLMNEFKRVLKDRFSSGFKLGNSIQLMRFKKFYEEMNGSPLNISDDEISEGIANCGLVHEDRLYVTETMLESELKSKLLQYFSDSFYSGIQRLYLTKIFDDFADDFRNTPVQNADILQTYLQELSNEEFPYYLYRKSVFKSPEDVKNCRPRDEILRLLQEARGPVSDNEIFEQLSYIPQNKIRDAFINCSTTREILSNGDHSRFVLDSFDIAGDQLDWIDSWLESSLTGCNFITSAMLIDAVKKNHPDIAERNEAFSDIGIRNAIACHLEDRFNFRDNLICPKNIEISNDQLIAEFCKEHETFSISDVEDFCESLGLQLQSFYFEVIYENAFRVSEELFVNEVPYIDVHAADSAIAQFMEGRDYIPISKVQFFVGAFPDIGYKWNSFCLESFLCKCSQEYKLIHSNFAKSACAGAIVRKNVNMDFNEILSDALSYEDWTESSAKEYLKSEGYLSRLKCSNIAQLLERAKQIRTQRNLKDFD